MECINKCAVPAEQNFTWLADGAVQSANLCTPCAQSFWNKFKNTAAGQSVTVSAPKTAEDMEELMKFVV